MYWYYISLLMPPLAPLKLKFYGSSNYMQKMIAYMNAPKTIYSYTFLSFIIYLILYAYVLTMEFCTLPRAPECALIIWTGTLVISEIQQISVHEGTLRNRVSQWWREVWNQIDFLAYSLFIAGVVTKCATNNSCEWFSESDDCCSMSLNSNLRISQILYAVAFILLMLRVMEFYMVGKNLGPKIIMISHMIKDFGFFVLLYAILLFSYGTAAQALLYPNDPRTAVVTGNIFFRPIMILFGELFLPEIHGYEFEGLPSPAPDDTKCDEECTNPSSVIDFLHDTVRCPNNHWFVQAVTVMYMFAANVLLINLLIAMFTYTFDRLQRNIDGDMDSWNSMRYEVISDYNKRMPLVPPINVFSDIFRTIKNCYKQMTKGRRIKTPEQYSSTLPQSMSVRSKKIGIEYTTLELLRQSTKFYISKLEVEDNSEKISADQITGKIVQKLALTNHSGELSRTRHNLLMAKIDDLTTAIRQMEKVYSVQIQNGKMEKLRTNIRKIKQPGRYALSQSPYRSSYFW